MLRLLNRFNRDKEYRESRDEIFIGELVFCMAHQGFAAAGFHADGGRQWVRFRSHSDPVLYSVTIELDRKTGGSIVQEEFVGSKATLVFSGEVKNHLTDPDELLRMYGTDIANLLRNPWLGDVKVDHRLNTIVGVTNRVIELNNYILNGDEGRQRLAKLLTETLAELHKHLGPLAHRATE